jgi:hypothetical protein
MSLSNIFWKLNDNHVALRKFGDFLHRSRYLGLVILCPEHEYDKTFRKNVELWQMWFRQVGVQNCRVIHQIEHKTPQELCVLIHHLHPHIKKSSRDVLTLQTEKRVVTDPEYLVVEFSDHYFRQRRANGLAESTLWLPLTWCLPPTPRAPMRSFEERSIDAVLFGAWSSRRQYCMSRLLNAGLNVVFSSDYTYYGEKLIDFLSNVKLYLNIGYNNALTSLETHRICQAANQHAVIISERTSDTDIQSLLDGNAVLFGNPVDTDEAIDQIANLIKEYKSSEDLWKSYCQRADTFWARIATELPHILKQIPIAVMGGLSGPPVDMHRFVRHVPSDFRNYARRMGRQPKFNMHSRSRARLLGIQRVQMVQRIQRIQPRYQVRQYYQQRQTTRNIGSKTQRRKSKGV